MRMLLDPSPKGSPVLGYLASILIRHYGPPIILHVHKTKAIAKSRIVFSLLNIDIELSAERFMFTLMGLQNILMLL